MPRPWTLVAAFSALAGALIVLGTAAEARGDSKLLARGRVERPAYTVVQQGTGFELRAYGPRLVAEVEVSGDPRQATEAGQARAGAPGLARRPVVI